MSQIIQCPGCNTRLQIPAGKSGNAFKCPTCGKMLRLSAPNGQAAPTGQAAGTAQPARSGPARRQPSAAPTQPSGFDFPGSPAGSANPPAFNPAAPRPVPTRAKKSAAGKTTSSSDLQPFMKRWLIGVGIACAFALFLGLIGLFFEVAAIFAMVICAMTILVCFFFGQFSIAILLGRESSVEGVVAVFIPLAGMLWAGQRRGPLLKGLAAYFSMLAPALLGLVLVFMHEGIDFRGGRRSSAVSAQRARMVHDKILEIQQDTPNDSPPVTVNFRIVGFTEHVRALTSRGDKLLGEFKHYVKGSMEIDIQKNTVSFQHRGNADIERNYAWYIAATTGALLSKIGPPADAAGK